jgi:hypothetical protein
LLIFLIGINVRVTIEKRRDAMGLLDILAFPLMGPIKGITWIAEKIAEQADNELYSEEAVRGKLVELEMSLEVGEISEEEYQAGEDVLLMLLKEARARQKAQQEE